jgi:hypothetical protein
MPGERPVKCVVTPKAEAAEWGNCGDLFVRRIRIQLSPEIDVPLLMKS